METKHSWIARKMLASAKSVRDYAFGPARPVTLFRLLWPNTRKWKALSAADTPDHAFEQAMTHWSVRPEERETVALGLKRESWMYWAAFLGGLLEISWAFYAGRSIFAVYGVALAIVGVRLSLVRRWQADVLQSKRFVAFSSWLMGRH